MSQKRILFVDDEPNVLSGLRRMLFKYKKEWDMHFFNTGNEVLEYLTKNSADIVISDMKMPVMDGISLFKNIKQRFPNVIRIILSGQSDEEQMKEAAVIAHQFLQKPCTSEVIKEVIDQAFFTYGIMRNESVRRILSKIDSLPTLPHVYRQLVAEANSPDFSLKRVGEIVATDASLSANILKLINSSFWGMSRKVVNPEQATSLLGFDVIKGLVLSTDLFHQLNVEDNSYFSATSFMSHSQSCSSLAKKIMKSVEGTKEDCDAASIAGMLHDLGKLILIAKFTKSYSGIIKLANDTDRALNVVEKEMIGITHAHIGAYLMGLWGLERVIIEAIAFHHDPELSSNRDKNPTMAVAAANYILEMKTGSEAMDNVKEYLDECGVGDRIEEWKRLV